VTIPVGSASSQRPRSRLARDSHRFSQGVVRGAGTPEAVVRGEFGASRPPADTRAKRSLVRMSMKYRVCTAPLLPVAPRRKTPAAGGGIRIGPLLPRSEQDGVRSTPYRLTPKPGAGKAGAKRGTRAARPTQRKRWGKPHPTRRLQSPPLLSHLRGVSVTSVVRNLFLIVNRGDHGGCGECTIHSRSPRAHTYFSNRKPPGQCVVRTLRERQLPLNQCHSLVIALRTGIPTPKKTIV